MNPAEARAHLLFSAQKLVFRENITLTYRICKLIEASKVSYWKYVQRLNERIELTDLRDVTRPRDIFRLEQARTRLNLMRNQSVIRFVMYWGIRDCSLAFYTYMCMRGQKRRNSARINCDQYVPRHAVGSIAGFIKFYPTGCERTVEKFVWLYLYLYRIVNASENCTC